MDTLFYSEDRDYFYFINSSIFFPKCFKKILAGFSHDTESNT